MKNLARRPARTAALTALVAVLAFSVFCGAVIVASLQNGLGSLEDRLGADIMVVPEDAADTAGLEGIVLQGNVGYFYMDESKLDEVAAIEGVGQYSAQLYLASAAAGCCSMKVQIMGYDPATDFVILPWVQDSYESALGMGEVVVGADLMAEVGDPLKFYDVPCTVVARLDKTGTNYDRCVFANEETVRLFIEGSLGKQLNQYAGIDPDRVVSCILVNVADGADIDVVVGDINMHVDGVHAIRTTNMTTGITSSLSGVSNMIGALIAIISVLAFVILAIAFTMTLNERRKEFAVLRVMGVSRSKLTRTAWKEVLALSFLGGVVGIAAGIVVTGPFGGLMEQQIGLPMLVPGAEAIGLYLLVSLAISLVAGSLAALFSIWRISRIDASLILSEGR